MRGDATEPTKQMAFEERYVQSGWNDVFDDRPTTYVKRASHEGVVRATASSSFAYSLRK